MKLKRLLLVSGLFVFLTLTSCLRVVIPDEKDFEFNSMTFIYDGEEHNLELMGHIPGGYEVRYINNNKVEVGSYEVLAQMYDLDHNQVLFTKRATLEIVLDFDLTKYSFESKNYIYDGNIHSVELIGNVPDGFKIVYENNFQKEAGKYYVTSKIVDDKAVTYGAYYAVMTIDNPQNEEFEKFMDEFFALLFEGDQMSINSLFKDYESFGLSRQNASLPKYEKIDSYDDYLEELQDLIDEFNAFENEPLSFEQQDTFKIISDYLNYLMSITENMGYMTNSYLGSYLGFQCELPLTLAEYSLRSEEDILDVISYLESSQEAFISYYDFCLDQVLYGYALTDDAIDGIIEQCENFVSMGSDNFLIGIFNQKIDEVSFELSSDARDNYKKQITSLIENDLTNAYQYIIDNLPTLKNKATTTGSLASFGEEGKAYYQLLLSNVLGIKDVSVEKVLDYISESYSTLYNEYINTFQEAQSKLSKEEKSKFISYIYGGVDNFSDIEIEDLLGEFRNLSKKLVPELTEMPNINLKYVPDALTDNFSPAAYFLSPLDETKYESVYLNPNYLDDYNYIFTTLAHEGYPGHLYQNVYSKSLDINKVRQVLRCNGYVEGWATYVEYKAYDFATKYNYSSPAGEYYVKILALQNRLNMLAQTELDIYANYICSNYAEFAQAFNTILGYYEDATVSLIYKQLIMIPTNTCMYAVSGEILMSLHDYASDVLGSDFDEVLFNKVLLDSGSAPLDIVIDNVNEYVYDYLFVNGRVDECQQVGLNLK